MVSVRADLVINPRTVVHIPDPDNYLRSMAGATIVFSGTKPAPVTVDGAGSVSAFGGRNTALWTLFDGVRLVCVAQGDGPPAWDMTDCAVIDAGVNFYFRQCNLRRCLIYRDDSDHLSQSRGARIGDMPASGVLEDCMVLGYKWGLQPAETNVRRCVIVSWQGANANDYTHEHIYGMGGNVEFTDNILLGKSFAAMMPSSDNVLLNSIVKNNVLALDGGSGVQYYRTTDKAPCNTQWYDNLVADKSQYIWDTESVTDRIAYSDHNALSNVGEPYKNISITGKSQGDPGFGGSDITVDASAELTDYGWGYPFALTADEVRTWAYDLPALLEAYRAAYRPVQGSPLLTAGRFGGPIGISI
jgi:hypothetical protein